MRAYGVAILSPMAGSGWADALAVAVDALGVGAAVGATDGTAVGAAVGTAVAVALGGDGRRRRTGREDEPEQGDRDGARHPRSDGWGRWGHLAYSTARVSRMTVTLIWPG